jgi:hypothetical protein
MWPSYLTIVNGECEPISVPCIRKDEQTTEKLERLPEVRTAA